MTPDEKPPQEKPKPDIPEEVPEKPHYDPYETTEYEGNLKHESERGEADPPDPPE
jgi:hypothetical protein